MIIVIRGIDKDDKDEADTDLDEASPREIEEEEDGDLAVRGELPGARGHCPGHLAPARIRIITENIASFSR